MMKIQANHPNVSDRVFAIFTLLAVSPLFFWFAMRGEAAKGRAAALSAGVLIVVIRLTWDRRRYFWFWGTMACLAAVHIAVISVLHWQERSYPGLALLPIAAADFCAMYGVVKAIEALLGRPELQAGNSAKLKDQGPTERGE